MKKTEELIEYVNSLELEQITGESFGETPEIKDDDAAAYVNLGSLVAFTAGLEKQQKQDVLNSTLIAQLGANKLFNRETQTEQWYGKYHEILENVGWVINSFDFTKYSVSGSSFKVQQVVAEMLAAIASENALLITKSAMEAVKSLSADSKGFSIWDTHTHDSGAGNFQIAPCSNSDGNVVMAISAFHFTAQTVDYSFLWFDYSSSTTTVYKGGEAVVLNEEIYALVRAAIIKKLGDHAVNYIANLEI